MNFVLVELDITADEELHKRYMLEIPVVEVRGREATVAGWVEEQFRRLIGGT